MRLSKIAHILLGVVCVGGSLSFAHEIGVNTDHKVYVHPSQIRFEHDGGIFIELPSGMLGVTSIQKDARGVYALVSERAPNETLDRCPNNHYSPRGNGRCNWPKCPYAE